MTGSAWAAKLADGSRLILGGTPPLVVSDNPYLQGESEPPTARYRGTTNQSNIRIKIIATCPDRAANLGQAIACYREALQVYTREGFPAHQVTNLEFARVLSEMADLEFADRYTILNSASKKAHYAIEGFEETDNQEALAEAHALLVLIQSRL